MPDDWPGTPVSDWPGKPVEQRPTTARTKQGAGPAASAPSAASRAAQENIARAAKEAGMTPERFGQVSRKYGVEAVMKGARNRGVSEQQAKAFAAGGLPDIPGAALNLGFSAGSPTTPTAELEKMHTFAAGAAKGAMAVADPMNLIVAGRLGKVAKAGKIGERLLAMTFGAQAGVGAVKKAAEGHPAEALGQFLVGAMPLAAGEIIRRPLGKEKPGATQKGQVKEGRIGEHPGDGQVRAPAETSGRGSVKPSEKVGGEVAKEAQKVTGVSERVRTRMASEGRAEEYQPGVGSSPEQMKSLGRQIIAGGRDPESLLKMMKKRGAAVSGREMAVLSAHDDALVKAADQARDALRADPNNPTLKASAERAIKAEQDWYNRISKYRTEFQKLGVAQQGQVDVDTGSFTSLTRHFENVNKRVPDPKEQQVAQSYVDKIKDLEGRLSKLQQQFEAQPSKMAGKTKLPITQSELAQHFAKRKADGSLYGSVRQGKEVGAVRISKGAPQFTQDEIGAIWNYSKQRYIGMGNVEQGRAFDFGEIIANVSRDLGLDQDEVIHAFTQNKTIPRRMVDEMYRLSHERRQAVTQAKAWVEAGNKNPVAKLFGAIMEIPRATAVLGHGGVGMITHAGPNIARPSSWSAYWPSVFKQWAVSLGKPGGPSSAVVHEQMLKAIESKPDFAFKVRSGLKIEPDRIYDDWQTYARYFGKAGGVLGELAKRGDRGMDVLKKFRDEYFDLEWKRTPDELKTPEYAKELAQWVNHASGSGNFPNKTIAQFMFAPSLEAARWARTVGDPIKTAKTYSDVLFNGGKNTTPEQKAIANLRVKRAAELIAVYVGSLAANTGLQSATGQQDKVNFTDPTKSDWLRYKWNGRTADPMGGVTAPLRFLATVAQSVKSEQPIEKVGEQSIRYARGKLAPTIEIGTELAFKRDFLGRPLPFASQKMKDDAAKRGKMPVSWREYAWDKAPIPVAGVAREVYDTLKEHGTEDGTARAIVHALEVLPFEVSGVRIGKSPKPFAPKGKADHSGDKYIPKQARTNNANEYIPKAAR